jgi:transcriptional regulator with XRE-family HTH domain
LAALRKARDLTQEQLAEELEVPQGSVSKVERQADMYVSTLRRYIEAMGGALYIVAHFPDADVNVDLFRDAGSLASGNPQSATRELAAR